MKGANDKDEGRRVKAESEKSNVGLRDLRVRTKEFALRVIRLYSALDKRDDVQQVLGRQMLRSGTSVGAQYREACRGRSDAEFVSKMNSALQELDETSYWLELLVDSHAVAADRLAELHREADELMAIFVTCIKKAGQKRHKAEK